MRKIFNKIKKNLYINKSLFVFLIVFVIIGLLSGSIYALILNEGDKKMVFDYLNTFSLWFGFLLLAFIMPILVCQIIEKYKENKTLHFATVFKKIYYLLKSLLKTSAYPLRGEALR